MSASHPRMKLSKLCTATARCVGERSTGPRVWTRHRAAKLYRKSGRCATRGSEGRGKQSKRIIAGRRVSRTPAHDSSRARAAIPDTTRSSVGAAAASVKVLRSSPHHDFAA